MIFSGICSIFCVLSFCSIKTWFKALWDFLFRKFACDLGFAAYQIFCPKGPCGTTFWQQIWLSSKINLLGIWKIQNVEQVQLVSDPILPASETFNQTLKNVNYCKNLKNCIRPWDRILHETCFVYNSTQKASPEELQVRIFTSLKFVKVLLRRSRI